MFDLWQHHKNCCISTVIKSVIFYERAKTFFNVKRRVSVIPMQIVGNFSTFIDVIIFA